MHGKQFLTIIDTRFKLVQYQQRNCFPDHQEMLVLIEKLQEATGDGGKEVPEV